MPNTSGLLFFSTTHPNGTRSPAQTTTRCDNLDAPFTDRHSLHYIFPPSLSSLLSHFGSLLPQSLTTRPASPSRRIHLAVQFLTATTAYFPSPRISHIRIFHSVSHGPSLAICRRRLDTAWCRARHLLAMLEHGIRYVNYLDDDVHVCIVFRHCQYRTTSCCACPQPSGI